MGGSAGSVLRSLRKLWGGRVFALRAGDFGVRFQGSLRTDSAPLGLWGAPRDRSYARRKARGRMGLSRFARGALVIAFNARCGPIPLRWAYGMLRGIGPALAEEALGRRGFRALREGFWCSLPRLAADRSRSAGRMGRSAGTVLRSLRRLWGGLGFRAVREGFWCSPPRLAPDRSRSAWRMGRSAGTVLRSLRRLWGGLGFRAVREGFW